MNGELDNLCCASFDQALQPGTDNEMYGRLMVARGGHWLLGTDLLPIRFCPWCGVKVRRATLEDEEATR